jgi:DNA invertase Pin-like site-specific DNA recombinase
MPILPIVVDVTNEVRHSLPFRHLSIDPHQGRHRRDLRLTDKVVEVGSERDPIGDLQDIVRAVKAKGATVKATEQPIDTGTAAGKCFLDMLGVFAEFETNLRKERQLEGIARAKAAGVYKGRPASIDPAQIRQLKAQGIGPSQIAKKLGIARASVYRALEG